jgi:hypothetical protein
VKLRSELFPRIVQPLDFRVIEISLPTTASDRFPTVRELSD